MRSTFLHGLVRVTLRLVGYGALGTLLIGLVVYVRVVESGPDLSVWHLADLDEEFTAESDVSSFEEYLALEERLFRQLDERVYSRVEGPGSAVDRYTRGSLSDPARWPVNWNRTFERRRDEPAAGVLMLHGLSDSPYSMRALGERLHEAGATVVGLRIPGHGTAPSGLVKVRWQDMAAAVRLAARHVRDAVGDRPFYLVGYSNGGALCIEYALAGLEDPSLPRPAGIVLLSPEIAVSGAAALAVWQARMGLLLGLDKLAWSSVLPEYDPFKYGSFAVNAGDVAHRLTTHVQSRLDALQGTGGLERLPPILAFQSGVDATVSADAIVGGLLARLPAAGHELVLFDVDRRVAAERLLKQDPRAVFEPLLRDTGRTFDLTVVSNEPDSDRVFARTEIHGDGESPAPTGVGAWPAGTYSLSHVALPFPPEDPLYGGPSAASSPGIQLGNLALRGEHGVLYVSGSDLLRLRWNPFFGYVESRILGFTGLVDPGTVGPVALDGAGMRGER